MLTLGMWKGYIFLFIFDIGIEKFLVVIIELCVVYGYYYLKYKVVR